MRAVRLCCSVLAASCVAEEEEIPTTPCDAVDWPGIPIAVTETGTEIPYRSDALGSGHATLEILDPATPIGAATASMLSGKVVRLRFSADEQPVLILMGDVPFATSSSIVDAEISSWTGGLRPVSRIELRHPETGDLLLASWAESPPSRVSTPEISLTYEPSSSCETDCGTYALHALRAAAGSQEVLVPAGSSQSIAGYRITNGFSWTYGGPWPERCTDQIGGIAGYVVPEP
jgi:hypothetical protein